MVKLNMGGTHVKTVSQAATAVALGDLSGAGLAIFSRVNSFINDNGITPGMTSETRQYIEHWQQR